MKFLSTLMMVTSTASEGGKGSSWTFLLIMGGFMVLMYFTMMRPQKKQQKREQELRENTQVGDEITTIGGICGRVVSVKDDTVVIETGADRVKVTFKKYAIQTNHTANEKIQAEREAAKAAAQEKKSKKSKKDEE